MAKHIVKDLSDKEIEKQGKQMASEMLLVYVRIVI